MDPAHVHLWRTQRSQKRRLVNPPNLAVVNTSLPTTFVVQIGQSVRYVWVCVCARLCVHATYHKVRSKRLAIWFVVIRSTSKKYTRKSLLKWSCNFKYWIGYLTDFRSLSQHWDKAIVDIRLCHRPYSRHLCLANVKSSTFIAVRKG